MLKTPNFLPLFSYIYIHTNMYLYILLHIFILLYIYLPDDREIVKLQVVNLQLFFSLFEIYIYICLWRGERAKNILFLPVFSRVLNKWIQSVYIHRHVFHPSHDSSVWLGLTNREQLMSPESSQQQGWAFPKCLWCGERTKDILLTPVFSRVLNE